MVEVGTKQRSALSLIYTVLSVKEIPISRRFISKRKRNHLFDMQMSIRRKTAITMHRYFPTIKVRYFQFTMLEILKLQTHRSTFKLFLHGTTLVF